MKRFIAASLLFTVIISAGFAQVSGAVDTRMYFLDTYFSDSDGIESSVGKGDREGLRYNHVGDCDHLDSDTKLNDNAAWSIHKLFKETHVKNSYSNQDGILFLGVL